MEDRRYLDFIRFIALILVVTLHVVSGVIIGVPEQMSLLQVRIYTVIWRITSFAVPFFLMISGSLFLDPAKKLSVSRLLTHYVRRLILAIALFGTVFALMEEVYNTHTFAPVYLWHAVVAMIEGRSWSHLWYVYMLVGVYLATPLLRAFIRRTGDPIYTYVLFLIFLFNSVIPFLESMFRFDLAIRIPIEGIYVFYFLLGDYLHRFMIRDDRRYPERQKSALVFGILILIGAVGLYAMDIIFNLGMDLSYESPLVIIPAVAVYRMMALWKKPMPIFRYFRDRGFTIYLVHAFYINLFYKVFHLTPLRLGGYILLPVFVIVIFLLSWGTAEILGRIPGLKKYVL